MVYGLSSKISWQELDIMQEDIAIDQQVFDLPFNNITAYFVGKYLRESGSCSGRITGCRFCMG
jgi:hypothetical protein